MADDAGALAAERLHALRQVPYVKLKRRADSDPEVEQVAGPSGRRYRRRTSVKRLRRGGGEALRVLVQIDGGSLLGRFNPLAEEMVLAARRRDGGRVHDGEQGQRAPALPLASARGLLTAEASRAGLRRG